MTDCNCVNEDIIIVTHGEKAEFSLFLEKNTLPRPYDLTNFDKFKATFLKSDETYLTITETDNANGSSIKKVSPDVLGQLDVILGPDDATALMPEYNLDIDLEWDKASTPNKKRKRVHKILNVEESKIDS
jgi:hypothetical protein